MFYSHNHNIDLRTAMNERTHSFIKIYTSHTLFLKGLMFLWCVRDEWGQGQTAILTQLLLLTIARCGIFKNPLITCSTGGHWGLFSICKLALSLAFLLPTDSTAAGTCPYSFITRTCFCFFSRLFTPVHHLIDGSVKGQYIITEVLLKKIIIIEKRICTDFFFQLGVFLMAKMNKNLLFKCLAFLNFKTNFLCTFLSHNIYLISCLTNFPL